MYCHFFTEPFCWIYVILERNHEIFMIKVQDEGQSTLSSYNTYTLTQFRHTYTHTPYRTPHLPLHASKTPPFHNTHTHTPIIPLSLDGKGRKTSIGSFLEHPLFYLKEVEPTKDYDFSPSPALNWTHFHSIDLASCPRQNKIKYELVAVDSASLTGK